jgi:type 2 lantibiotic biosynthesis protein LanM
MHLVDAAQGYVTETTKTNSLSRGELISICERSSWMFERLTDAYAEVEGEEADAARNRRLAEWKQVIAAGNDERFYRRLAWDGLSDAAVRKALGPVRLRDSQALPSWAHFLYELCVEATENHAEAKGTNGFRFLLQETPLAYEDIMAPIVVAASRKFKERCHQAFDLFSEEAVGALERALLRRLALFMTETLNLEFYLFRHKRISSLDLLWMKSVGYASKEVYLEFVAHMMAGGLRRLVLEYPVMGRLVATASELWVNSSSELVRRFQADRDEIAERFASEPAPLRVAGLEGLLSDSHNGGLSVSILTFQTGLRIVYKPRPVANERAWFDLLDWLNRHGSPEQLKLLRVLERPGYGWVETIAPHPVRDGDEAVRYYRRCGVLLALTYVIGTNDAHLENLIADGDQPVLVDLETILCHSPIETIYGTATEDLLKTVFFESVVRTGLLPRWQTGESIPVDVSGLGAVTAQRSRIPIPQWKDVNSDTMELVYETVEGSPGPNAARLDGQPLSPNRYVEEIVAGFSETYRLLIAERERLLASGGPVDALGNLSVRFILRATAFYLMVAKSSRFPFQLRDGVERSILLDAITAPLLFAETRPLAWPLIVLERQSLEIEDCPYFTLSVQSAAINDPRGGSIAGIVEAPCFEQTAARLRRLNEADLVNQLGLVRASFDSRTEALAHTAPLEPVQASVPLETSQPLSRDEMLEEAVRVGEMVLHTAIPGGRAPNWITLRFLTAIEKNQLDPIGPDLFEGRAGIALFLAALYRLTGLARFGDVARAIASVLRTELASLTPDFAPPDILVHGATGIVSLTYVLPHLAEMLEDPGILADANRAAQFITHEAVAADRRYDVLSGSAGSLLALLRLSRANPGDAALEQAVECGDHLLAQREAGPDGLRRWQTFESQAISGFAHGNAGIAFALLRLFSACGEERFRAAALEAIAFENTTFSAAEGNWPDLRWPQPSFAAGWCHGAPGIALARVEARRHAEHLFLSDDIEVGAAVAMKSVSDGSDHICCGNFGRVLVLQEIGRSTNRPELVKMAESLAARLVWRARKQEGRYRFLREYVGYVSFPGLFQGMSGVGYSLLRLAFPDLVPAVIRLE